MPPVSKRDRYLKRKYGISEAEYDRLLAAHEGGCWVCGRLPARRRLHVEHDHKRRKGKTSVRGITCWQCNAGIKRFGDDPTKLRRAADYLESTEAQEILDATTDQG